MQISQHIRFCGQGYGPRPRCALVNYITLYTILCALLGIFIPAQAMLYRPEKGAMWDPSVIWHDGKYYAFMMYNKEGREGLKAKHCLLASSTDGVHWALSTRNANPPGDAGSSSVLLRDAVISLSWTMAWRGRRGRILCASTNRST
jgi:hypothetical protein